MNKAIKKAMIDKELTIRKMAVQMGYSYNQLRLILNGKTNSFRAKRNVALVLGREFSELWGKQE